MCALQIHPQVHINIVDCLIMSLVIYIYLQSTHLCYFYIIIIIKFIIVAVVTDAVIVFVLQISVIIKFTLVIWLL